jgi:hypothetical protein
MHHILAHSDRGRALKSPGERARSPTRRPLFRLLADCPAKLKRPAALPCPNSSGQHRRQLNNRMERSYETLWRTLGPMFTSLVLLSIAAVQAGPQTAALPTANSKPTNLRMFVDPSSTSLALGRASLTVSPLTYQKQTYAGDYQLKVVPFLYKSQAGKLSLAAPDDSVHRLAEGLAVEFSGKAVNQKDDKTKVVKGKITPISKDRGTVAFSIATENGELVFNTSYHFAP